MSVQDLTEAAQEPTRGGRLQDKVVVITGASSGIGRATMEIAGREGAKVVGTARTESKLQEALEGVQAAGGDGMIVPADLEDTSSAERVVQTAVDAYGRVDVLVTSAGVGWQYGIDNPGTMAGVHEASLENWRAIIGGVDLEGFFLAIHAVLPPMLERGSGSIVNIGSLYASVAPDPRFYDHIRTDPPFLKPPAYGASKAAVVNLTKYFATAWGPYGVRVNTLSPGGVLGAQDEQFKRKFCERVPLGRMAVYDDLVGPLQFLASDASAYVTGAELRVDGGFTAW
jgi:NAD(P)-dependent dehydrogenase (short-subunit alcohol dehydrogenase family)